MHQADRANPLGDMRPALYEPIRRQGTRNPAGGAGRMDEELRTQTLELNQDVYDKVEKEQKRIMENNGKRITIITYIGIFFLLYMVYNRMEVGSIPNFGLLKPTEDEQITNNENNNSNQNQQKSFSFPNPFQIFGGGIKNACLKFDEEMSANLNVNPIEMVEKVNSTNKKLMDAVGLTYYEVSKTTFDLEKNQSNIKGLNEASEKCKKEGVILDGVNN